MVKIIKGTFGYFDGRMMKTITESDGPKEFDPELEARLVQKGVAEYVEKEPKEEKPTEKEPKEEKPTEKAGTKKEKAKKETEEAPPVLDAADPV